MAALITELTSILGADGVLARPEELFVYEADGLTHHSARPSAVVLPRDAGEVQSVVRACRRHGVPFVPRGASTGLSGGAVACHGGVVIECDPEAAPCEHRDHGQLLRRVLNVTAPRELALAPCFPDPSGSWSLGAIVSHDRCS